MSDYDLALKLLQEKLDSEAGRVTGLYNSLDDSTKESIKFLQERLELLKAKPLAYYKPKDAAKVVESIEYVLQMLWGFDLDNTKHTHWYNIEGCTCPKRDNKERWGFQRVTMLSCPFHGG